MSTVCMWVCWNENSNSGYYIGLSINRAFDRKTQSSHPFRNKTKFDGSLYQNKLFAQGNSHHWSFWTWSYNDSSRSVRFWLPLWTFKQCLSLKYDWDKVGCMVIVDFQIDQHHLMLKEELDMRPYMVTKRRCVLSSLGISLTVLAVLFKQ